MTLTKADWVGHIIEQSGLDRPDAKQLVNQMFEEISGSLETGEAVKLAGFGSFELRDKRPSRGATRRQATVAVSRPGAWRPSRPAIH